MTGDASYQQLGVDAMMSSCFLGGGGGVGSVFGADTEMFHAQEYTPHDGSLFGFGEPAVDVAARFYADDGASKMQLVRAAAPQSVPYGGFAGGYGGPSPSDDVTVALPPKMATSSWVHEPYYRPAWFSGDDPFVTAASKLPLRLRAQSSSTGTVVNMSEQSSDVSCSGLTHASSSAAGHGLFQPPYGDELGQACRQMARPRRLHFSQVLSRSGYAHIVQQTLDEFVGCLLQDAVAGIAGSAVVDEASYPLPSSSCSKTASSSPSEFLISSEEQAHEKHRNGLLRLLQLMDQRCNQYLDEIQSAASKYGSMVGGGSLSAPFALRAVSATHRRLRARIVGEIAARTGRASREPSSSASASLADRERSWESAFIQKHWALRQMRRGDQQSWRPQRGLPEKSVAVLKAWMFENFLRPYPKDNEKDMLAARSGLSRSQVSNWFINARVRLWKPMIEEMYEDLKKASESSSESVPV